MKLRMKSISMLIAAVVAIGCLAAPMSANAASINAPVIQITEVSVSKEAVDHSSVKSTEKIEDQSTENEVVSDKAGFSVVEDSFAEETTPVEPEEEVVVPTTDNGSVVLTNPIKGTQNKVIVEKTTITVPLEDLIKINKEDVTLSKKSSYTLAVTVDDKYKNNGITWTTSNKSVATVSAKGVVNAVGKGSCYVTATINGTNIAIKAKISVQDYILMEVKTTAYCGCKKCNGKWYGAPTATGTQCTAGRTIAVDKNVIKLGSKVEIDGNIYIAEDTGVKGKHIDIFFDSHSAALKYGVKTKIVKVYI